MNPFNSVLLLIYALTLTASAEDILKPLQGTWKSDKEATHKELRTISLWTAEQIKEIERFVGRVTLSFAGTTMHLKYPNQEYKGEPHVTTLKDGRTKVEYTDSKFGKEVIVIELDRDGMWVTWPQRALHIRERLIRQSERAESGRRE